MDIYCLFWPREGVRAAEAPCQNYIILARAARSSQLTIFGQYQAVFGHFDRVILFADKKNLLKQSGRLRPHRPPGPDDGTGPGTSGPRCCGNGRGAGAIDEGAGAIDCGAGAIDVGAGAIGAGITGIGAGCCTGAR